MGPGGAYPGSNGACRNNSSFMQINSGGAHNTQKVSTKGNKFN